MQEAQITVTCNAYIKGGLCLPGAMDTIVYLLLIFEIIFDIRIPSFYLPEEYIMREITKALYKW